MTAIYCFPAWMNDVRPDQRALAKACGLDWTTLPRAFYFGKEPQPVIVSAPANAPSDLLDSEWTELRGIFPARSARRNGRDWRRVLDSVLYLKASGTRWTNLPKRYGAPAAQRKACEAAAVSGLWVSLLERIDNGELAALTPERLRQLRAIASDWMRKGERYQRARA